MKILFAVFLVLHGFIHLLGTAKAFGFAEALRLTRPIGRPLGVVWLLAAALLVADYRQFGTHRLMARGEAIWHAAAGAYSYLRFDLDAIEYNVAAPR